MSHLVVFCFFAFLFVGFSEGTFCSNGLYQIKALDCPETCDNIYLRKDCSATKKYHCKCYNGYILDKNDVCQTLDSCLKSKCGENAIFRKAPCSKSCQDHLDGKSCTAGTVPGCECLEGFYLGQGGKCINERQCYNELNVCANGVYDTRPCSRTCKNMFTSTTCTVSPKPGCKCNIGYFLNSKGRCVLPSDCDEVTCIDPNSVFSPTSCVKTCENYLFNQPCTPSNVPTCICKPGYYLSSQGKCVTETECQAEDPCRSRNGVISLKPCNLQCETLFTNTECIESTMPACQCNDGYYQTSNGDCVKPEDCTGVICKPNSEFSVFGCEHSCSSHLFSTDCQQYEGPKCSCTDGFYRNSVEECVNEESCKLDLGICPENSEYSDTPCSKTCENMFFGACVPETSPGCQCKNGYFKNSNGVCVEANQCDIVRCKDNFEFKPSSCIHTCKSHLFSEPCIPNPEPACVCKDGLFLNSKGRCVSEETCRKDRGLCPKNSSFKDTPCSKTCLKMFIDEQCAPESSPGCQCDDGYFKNKNGRCVRAKNCDEVQCNPNSFFTITSCEHTCKSHLLNEECVQLNVPKCSCQEGFYRNSLGECVTEESCKLDLGVCPENSEYSEQPCSITCENLFIGGCDQETLPGCQCKEGYYKNVNGDCVTKDKCSGVRCNPNSSFNLISCEHTCATVLFSKDCILNREPSCSCDPGYARNSAGDCVSKESCKSDPEICPENSSYQDAIECPETCKNLFGLGGCEPQAPGCKCDEGYYMSGSGECVKDVDCDEVICEENSEFGTSACEHTCKTFLLDELCVEKSGPACYCSDGYYRNSTGKCVSEEICEEDEGVCEEENTVFDKDACELTCKNFLADETCTSQPQPGCRCKDGYYRHNGVCISREACSETEVEVCPKCSVYRKNPRIQTCEDMFGEIVYSDTPGCECIEGFFLNEKGVCVAAEQCKNVKCPVNSIFKATSCTLTCKNHLLGEQCTKCITPQCACQPGFYLHSNGNCVSREECVTDPGVCDANSIFQEAPCSMSCLNMFTGAKCTPSSRPGCQCNDGYYSDSFRHCVAARECDDVKCPKNAYFDSCSSGNQKTCGNMYLGLSETEPECLPECVCMNGFVMNGNGICVEPEKCPISEIKCPSNLVYNKCGNRFHQICSLTMGPVDKLAECIPGCYCEDGTVYDQESNACVTMTNCLVSLQNIACRSMDPLMAFYTCHNGPAKTCETAKRPSKPDCRSGCFCKDGYVLNKRNRCVSVDTCPSLV